MAVQADSSQIRSGRRRIAPIVALALLEVIRDQDLPGEVLADEDVSLTLPRRLGLSDVVENQIRRYREAVRKRRRVSDEEFADLVRLVVRRSDSEDVFRQVGRRLADVDEEARGVPGILPRRVVLGLARRRAGRRLKALFGRKVGSFPGGAFGLEGRDLIFIGSDPGGDACFLVSGLLEGVAGRYGLGSGVITHPDCEAYGADLCRWVMDDGRADSGIRKGVEPA